jgi:hypothetical protein
MMSLVVAAALAAILDPSPTLTGNCNPTRVRFTGHITADAPVKVTYTWVRMNYPSGRTFTLDFSKAGSLPVSYDLLLRKREEGAVMLRIVLPQPAESAKVKYKVACK